MSERLIGAAKAEAERRWPDYPHVGFSGADDRQQAFMQGVLWHRARGGDFTDAPTPSDDDLAVFHDHETGAVRIGPCDGSPLTLDQALALVNRRGAVSVSREQVDQLAYQVCQHGGHIPNRDRSLPGSCDFHRRMATEYVAALGIEVSD